MLQIKAHCPSDKSLCFHIPPCESHPLEVHLPFGVSFFLNHFRSWNDEGNHNNALFSWLLCHVNALRKLPPRDFASFSFYDVFGGTVICRKGRDALGFLLCALPNVLVGFLRVTEYMIVVAVIEKSENIVDHLFIKAMKSSEEPIIFQNTHAVRKI